MQSRLLSLSAELLLELISVEGNFRCIDSAWSVARHGQICLHKLMCCLTFIKIGKDEESNIESRFSIGKSNFKNGIF